MAEALSFLDPLRALPGLTVGWLGRVPGVDVSCDRDEAMRRLRPHHERWLADSGADGFHRAEQVHGTRVVVVPGAETVTAADGLPCAAGADGLVTNTPGVTLGIYVADCGPLWLCDPVRRVAGLVHSGKKGTEGDVFGAGIAVMHHRFGTVAGDVTAVLGPCIRPPDYEVDFAAGIARQAGRHGVGRFADCGINTAADPERHYSYRRELGKTGRMLAIIRLES